LFFVIELVEEVWNLCCVAIGVTLGEELGTTISFGFRAPDLRSLSTALWDEVCSAVPAERAFYQDGADLGAVPESAGRIADTAAQSIASRMQDMVRNYMT
jgi:ribosomal protein L16 Arg81 hydroxylase